MLALNATSGEELFRVAREGEKSNWATPYIWKNSQRTELVTPGTVLNRSYDLEGRLLWELKGMSSITIATPYAKGDLLYLSSGYVMDKMKPIYCIRPGGSGDISLGEDQTSNEFIVWSRKDAGPYNPSTLIYGDQMYVLYDQGFFGSLDPKTGEDIYKRQRIPDGKAFTASPWAYGDKIFCLNEDGVTFVVAAGQELRNPAHQHARRRRHVHGHPRHCRRSAAAADRGPAILHPTGREARRVIARSRSTRRTVRAGGRLVGSAAATAAHQPFWNGRKHAMSDGLNPAQRRGQHAGWPAAGAGRRRHAARPASSPTASPH